MAKIRIYNRQGAAEILGGLVGGPLLVAFIAWTWLADSVPDVGETDLVWVVASIAIPILAIYWFYRALVLYTLWMDFSSSRDHVVIRKLLGNRDYPKTDIQVAFDKKPIEMSESDLAAQVTVGHERYLLVKDRRGHCLGKARINRADQILFFRFLQDCRRE